MTDNRDILLHIDTALDTAHCALSKNGVLLNFRSNTRQYDHAAWLHPAIDALLKENDINGHQMAAISVTEGPGSYTGLRVSMAAAKGLCYAWQLPLITVSSLRLLAMAALETAPGATVIYPMIDARRMEVFMAGYNNTLHETMPPAAVVLNEQTAARLIAPNTFFCGNGAFKMAGLGADDHSIINTPYGAEHHVLTAFKMFAEKMFTNVAYCEPLYAKPVYTTAINSGGQ